MNNEPDLNHDIDALFEHLTKNLLHNIDEEQDWIFFLRSSDIDALQQVAEELESEFAVQLQETVEEADADGNVSLGPGMLSVIRRGALNASDVKQIAERVKQIAADRGLSYEGVSCYEPIDEEELFGWLPPEEAGWRLRHLTDCGLADDAELPWAFLVVAPTLESAAAIASELRGRGFDDLDQYDEPDEEGRYGLCVFLQGRNNEIELNENAQELTVAVELHGGDLIGIQFYTREEVAEVFGAEDEV